MVNRMTVTKGMSMYQQGGTIEKALGRIERHEYVLPAIQREFVWNPEQICALFDSLMQGYPHALPCPGVGSANGTTWKELGVHGGGG